MAQALVPLKDLVKAKTRLAGLLRPSERRALAQAMAEDVLAVLAAHAQIQQVTLVSDDPCAPLLAQKYGIQCWSEQSLGSPAGLNAVISCASERLLQCDTGPLIVLHADLPLLESEDITTVLTAQADGGLVIGCDRRGQGTNLLVFDARSLPRFAFGSDSCAAHLAGAENAAQRVTIVERKGTALDVDEPQDLKALMEIKTGITAGQTLQFLQEPELRARLTVALASLDTQELDISISSVNTEWTGE